MSDLLFEIGTEEMPAGVVLPALDQIARIVGEGLDELRLSHGEIATYATPRRLAVLVSDTAQRQPDREVEYKGPPAERAFTEDGDPTDAAFGFAKARGVDVKALSVKETDNGVFVAVTVKEEGRAAVEVLPEMLAGVIGALDFPKTMRWGNLDVRFIRPIRWLVALLGSEVIPLEVAGLTSGRVTWGHRVLSPEAVELADASEYLASLERAHVTADHRVRRQRMLEQAEAIAAEVNGTPVLHDDTVDENSFLVEWPLCILGSFDQRYLELPDEVIATVMEKHQSYFPVVAESGALMARFIVVANVGAEAADTVRAGNEKVIGPRLADAEFYIQADTKATPEQSLEKLRRVTFLENLGTLHDKTMRLQILATWLCERVGADEAEIATTQRAALLSKTDQISQMIGDTKLAGLQGTVGAYYALVAGEDRSVSRAIAEQYMPLGPDSPLPATMPGALLAVADKLDNLAASFLIGADPSGTKDPTGLRRQASGIIAIARDRGLHFSLDDIISLDMGLLPELPEEEAPDIAKATARLRDFMAGRIENYLQAAGVRYDTIRAVLATSWHDMVETIARAEALTTIRAEDSDFGLAVDTATRPANIVRPSDLPADVEVGTELFAEPIEQQLWDAYQACAERVREALTEKGDYLAAWEALRSLQQPIDDYFVQVMVNVEDQALRTNRLAVMRRLDRLYLRLADFTQIVQ